MEENTNYVKRSQRDYSMSLKLQSSVRVRKFIHYQTRKNMAYKLDPVVQWLRKFGSFDWENKHHNMSDHPNKDYGLEAK
jgi:hypothetical protein